MPEPIQHAPESFHVSARFRLTLLAAIRTLESGAARDERILRLIDNPDHRRRQLLLIAGQLDKAFRLRELLDRTQVRPTARAGKAA